MKRILMICALMCLAASPALAGDRWELSDPGGIQWTLAGNSNLPHEDHLEMSGLRGSAVVFFGADKDRGVTLHRQVIWPMLRTIPNNTAGSLGRAYDQSVAPQLKLDGQTVSPILDSVTFDGLLKLTCHAPGGLAIERTIFPSTDEPAVLENWSVQNASD